MIGIINDEEAQFLKTLTRGKTLFHKAIKELPDGAKELPGDVAWRLYDTYGYPLDLTQLMAEESGLTIDTDEYEKSKAEAQVCSSKSSSGEVATRRGFRSVRRPASKKSKRRSIWMFTPSLTLKIGAFRQRTIRQNMFTRTTAQRMWTQNMVRSWASECARSSLIFRLQIVHRQSAGDSQRWRFCAKHRSRRKRRHNPRQNLLLRRARRPNLRHWLFAKSWRRRGAQMTTPFFD